MRLSVKRTFQAILFIFAPLVLPLHTFAEGDDTNASKIKDLSLWADMYQVMAGTSKTTPDQLKQPLRILTPQGIYAYVLVDSLVMKATKYGIDKKTALKNYFTFLLNQPEVSGILFAAPWSLLNRADPATNLASTAYDWSILDVAFDAVIAAGKNLQLNVTAGFNSPGWLYQPVFKTELPPAGYLSPCDSLFANPPLRPAEVITPATPSCGYTSIFVQTEVAHAQVGPATLPLPWNTTYKNKWKAFLQELWKYIKSKNWQQHLVSIAVAGPTATSSEIILPNEHNQTSPLQLSWAPANGYTTKAGINALSAWNCLLANNYGVNSPYLNSDRAFIEEWATAIDMFGEVFDGLTLTVATGNGLPNFQADETSVTNCALSGISLPNSSTPGYSKLSVPHPAFLPDCGTSPLHPMDCAAETAILAYFAEPPVGGPNAKATQENALAASDDVVSTLLSLSNASVKWLSRITEYGLDTMQGVGPAGQSVSLPIVSRVLGGLQFNAPAAQPDSAAVEQTLLSTLQVFFAGTSKAVAFGASPMVMNNGTPVKAAPINYLQIWAGDIVYAAGFGHCSDMDIMMTSPPSKTMPCYKKHQPMPTVKIGSKKYTARDLLILASNNIPTAKPLLPLFGYSGCMDKVSRCAKMFYRRGAFDGDLVCVTKPDEIAAKMETDDGRSSIPSKNHYSTKATNYSILPVVPYGRCDKGYYWRQAYMGDYVCVNELARYRTLEVDNGLAYGAVSCPP